ncbi:MAG: glutathione S-transferase family protein [Pseudomonadales bacterium]|nr:glutathione S-transferase family protein [Pseudomonadales bacterium]
MKLYYAPGTCALAVHIALIWSGEPYELVKVDLASETFKKINPMSAVPALEDGDSGIMTQADSLMNYISASYPDKQMSGDTCINGKQKYNQWMAFISSDLHSAYGPVFNPQRCTIKQDEDSLANAKASASTRLRIVFGVLDKHLDGKEYIVADRLTCADPFAYIMTRWLTYTDVSIDEFPHVKSHFQRLAQEPAVIQAETEQGIR